MAQGNLLSVEPPAAVPAKRGSTVQAKVKVLLQPGYHANSNTPTDSYLIPLTLKWTGGPLQMDSIVYPKAALEKYSFSDKPLSVVTGAFEITTKFKVPANAPNGASSENGTIRYQACNDRMCFAPKTIPVTFSISVD